MRKVLIGLAVLVAALVVVDRVAIVVATGKVDQRIEQEVGSPVDTTLGGFPFLPSALSRTLPSVHVRAGQVRMHQADLTIQEVDFRFTDVSVQGNSSARAGSLSGSFVVDYPEVERRANRPRGSLSGGEDGLLRIRRLRSEATSNAQEEEELVARPQVLLEGSHAVAQLVPVSVQVEGQQLSVTSGLGATLAHTMSYQISLRELPAGMRVVAVRAQPQGLRVQVEGNDTAVSGW